MQSEAWQNKMKEMTPSFGKTLGEEPGSAGKILKETSKILGLTLPEVV